MGRPLIIRLEPPSRARDMALTLQIIGDGMTGVLKCDMGPEIELRRLKVLGDAAVEVDVAISANAAPGTRDVTLSKEKPHEVGTLKDGFVVV